MIVDKEQANEVRRKALFDLSDSYAEEKPQLMVPHVTAIVLSEAVRILRAENESLRAELADARKESAK